MLYFLASIPRSGSTLLASLLGQRQDTYVTPTSNLGKLLGSVVFAFQESLATKAEGCNNEELFRILRGMIDSKFADIPEEIIFDKGRMWPDPVIMSTMEKVFGEPIKIIATVRPVEQCIASAYLISNVIQNRKVGVKEWIKESLFMDHLKKSYKTLMGGYKAHPENFLLVEYDNLCADPQHELNRVADFIGIQHFKYNPCIDQVKEDDNAWEIENLHTLRDKIEKTSEDPKEILGKEIFDTFYGNDFWVDGPTIIKDKHLLDLSLEAGLRGDFKKGFQILKEREKTHPNDDRCKFNLGIYEMMNGNLLRGHHLLDCGRSEDVFGNRHIGTSADIWNKHKDVTVLMEMEGGLGDQIHCLRYVKMVADFGCRVILSGSPELAPLMKDAEGVSCFIDRQAATSVCHDYWLPSMSAPVVFSMEWSDVSGKPYIERDGESEGKVGVRWAGNQKFEHEQHRIFPEQFMFDTVSGLDCISLQRDKDVPDWMEKPSLETWTDTRKAISRCDLVITSCTSVAHLSAAMGIKTWIVVPILPYYLWALPGNKTPYYDNVTLYRHHKRG